MEITLVKRTARSVKPKVKSPAAKAHRSVRRIDRSRQRRKFSLNDPHKVLLPKPQVVDNSVLFMESSRSKLLSAAVRLFAEKGFFRVSTKDIATSAGVSETHLFRLFGNKDSLASAAIDRMFQEAIVKASEYSFDNPDFTKCILGFGDHLYSNLVSNPHWMRMMYYAALDTPHIFKEILGSHELMFVTKLARRIDKAQNAHEVRDDISSLSLARSFIAAVTYPYLSHHILKIGQIYSKHDHYRNNVKVWLEGACTRTR